MTDKQRKERIIALNAQVQTLTTRLSELEADNTRLQSENAALRHQCDTLTYQLSRHEDDSFDV